MATTPAFASTPAFGSGTITAAMTGTTAVPTNSVTVFTASSSGARVDEIDICGLGTNVANVIRFWIYDGTTYSLLKEVQVSALTASTTAAAYQNTLTFNNLVLPAAATAYTIKAAPAVVETNGFKISVFGGNF